MSRAALRNPDTVWPEERIPEVPMPVDLTDEAAFPELARLRRHYASLSAERRDELDREWVR